MSEKTLQERLREAADMPKSLIRTDVALHEAADALDRLEAQLREAREERDDAIAIERDYGIDLRLWSVKEILTFLENRARMCLERDLCSMAPTELSYCGTMRAAEELKARLAATEPKP